MWENFIWRNRMVSWQKEKEELSSPCSWHRLVWHICLMSPYSTKVFSQASQQDRLYFSQHGDKWHCSVSAPVSVGVSPQGCCCMVLWIRGSRCIFTSKLASPSFPYPWVVLLSYFALHPPDMVNLSSNAGLVFGGRECTLCYFRRPMLILPVLQMNEKYFNY